MLRLSIRSEVVGLRGNRVLMTIVFRSLHCSSCEPTTTFEPLQVREPSRTNLLSLWWNLNHSWS